MKKFLHLRMDLFDISNFEVRHIQNETVLLKEYEHINKLLEQKDNLSNKVFIFSLSGIAVFIGYIISNIFSLVEKGMDPDKQKNIIELTNFVFDTLLSSVFIFLIVVFFLIILEMFNRKKIIDRKVLVLVELKKELNRQKSKKYIEKYKIMKRKTLA